MKRSLFSFILSSILFSQISLAAERPAGDITFYNASQKNVTAKVSHFGQFTLEKNESKSVSYSTLAQICSGNTTKCTAYFYVNNAPVGSATINAETGKLTHMNLAMKVKTVKNQQILRSVIIK